MKNKAKNTTWLCCECTAVTKLRAPNLADKSWINLIVKIDILVVKFIILNW